MEDLKAKQVCLDNLIHNTYQIKKNTELQTSLKLTLISESNL